MIFYNSLEYLEKQIWRWQKSGFLDVIQAKKSINNNS